MDIPDLVERAANRRSIDGDFHIWPIGAECEWTEEKYTYNVTCTSQRDVVDVVGRVRENETGDTVRTVEKQLHVGDSEDEVVDALSEVIGRVDGYEDED